MLSVINVTANVLSFIDSLFDNEMLEKNKICFSLFTPKAYGKPKFCN